MKIVIAPDSFKGSCSAVKAANAIEKGIFKVRKEACIHKIPMADGGEGTVEAIIMAAGGDIRKVEVTGPLGERVRAFYGVLKDGKTGVIEMAAASGLVLVPLEKRNPLKTTSFGTGELIKHAIRVGCTKLIIGIGGSATNDGGMGMAQALGVRFSDSNGQLLGFDGESLSKLEKIDCSGMLNGLDNIEFVIACDVVNPLCGETGASNVFGPQKGADTEMVKLLDRGLLNFAGKIKCDLGKDIAEIPGSGAAGGLGGGIIAFLNGTIKPGIEILAEITCLEDKIKEADLVITGEGRTDFQTAFGKVPVGVARIAKKYQVPVVCLSGGLGEGIETLYEEGITALFSIVDGPMNLEKAMKNVEELLSKSSENIIRLYAGR